MKKIILILIAVFAVSTSFAMLPPFYHTLNEIQTILADERLSEALGSAEGITKIEKVDGGYLITSYRYQLKVDVNYLPQQLIGRGKFELKFNEKVPLVEISLFENDNAKTLAFNKN
jgi:hypothetical protein